MGSYSISSKQLGVLFYVLYLSLNTMLMQSIHIAYSPDHPLLLLTSIILCGYVKFKLHLNIVGHLGSFKF